jgi:hypothetical protein
MIQVMTAQSSRDEFDELAARIAVSCGVPATVARRIVEDVIAQYTETVAEYVGRRHRELSEAGWKNPAIYAQLRDEIAGRPFAQPACTERQIRRMIYG